MAAGGGVTLAVVDTGAEDAACDGVVAVLAGVDGALFAEAEAVETLGDGVTIAAAVAEAGDAEAVDVADDTGGDALAVLVVVALEAVDAVDVPDAPDGLLNGSRVRWAMATFDDR